MIAIRGTRENMFALGDKAQSHDWENPELRNWFFRMCGLLCLFGGMAASKTASKDREEARHRICWHLGSLLRDPMESEEDEQDMPRKDVEFLNLLTWEAIELYGLHEALRECFPQMQEGDSPLFAEDSWPGWWEWAQNEFFLKSLPQTSN